MPPRSRGRATPAPEESVNAVVNPANPLQQFVELLATALQNGNATPTENPNPTIGQLASFKDFKAVGPPEF